MHMGLVRELLPHERSELALMNFLVTDYGIEARRLSSMALSEISACVKEAAPLC